jgi:hypothetical protein
MVVPVLSGVSKPCGPVTMVDLSPANDRARFSASARARLTAGSAFVGGSGGGGGKGGGGGILGGLNGPMHMIILSLVYMDQSHVEPWRLVTHDADQP